MSSIQIPSFMARVRIAMQSIAKDKYPEAQLFVVKASDQNQAHLGDKTIDLMTVGFKVGIGYAELQELELGSFGPAEITDFVPEGAFVFDPSDSFMDLPQALELKAEAGFESTVQTIELCHPNDGNHEHPAYIFNSPINDASIYVDTQTHKVTQSMSPGPIPYFGAEAHS